MRLLSFTASDYRSIKKSPKLPINDSITVLLGPNNEGKSNVLRAFAVAMQLLESMRRFPTDARIAADGSYAVKVPYFGKEIYEWRRDYPVGLQKQEPVGRSTFALEFELRAYPKSRFMPLFGS